MVSRTKPAGCCTPAAIEPLPRAALDRLSRAAKALADPTRIEILRLVARQQGPLCACDIVGHVDLAQPTVSHHLKVLKDGGLLRASRNGLWMFYTVDPAAADLLAGLPALVSA